MTDHPGLPTHARRGARGALALLAVIVLAACGTGPSTGPGGSGAPSPLPTDTVGEIDHPTDATTVILRVDEGGGFVPPSFFVTQAPAFSLYGDRTAIFRDPSAAPPPVIGQVIRSAPFQAVRLSEDEVQTLLAFALGPGGLAIARESYQLPVADAPTTTFTIVAGGIAKKVSVNGLGIGADGGADAPILNALATLRARLMSFGSSVGGETPWQPDRYRGVLMDGSAGPGAIDWPWKTFTPNDFTKPNDPNGPGFATRTLAPADITALGVDDLTGGAQGFSLMSPFPGKRLYAFAVRPLLPDEPR